jgi:hypothetical protein
MLHTSGTPGIGFASIPIPALRLVWGMMVEKECEVISDCLKFSVLLDCALYIRSSALIDLVAVEPTTILQK